MNKSENFRRLAEKRVNKAIAMLRLIGNLSNTALYKYEDKEVKKIIDALTEQVNYIKSKFKTKKGDGDENGFRF